MFNFCNIKLIAIVKTKDIREANNYPLLTDFIITINQLYTEESLVIKLKINFPKIFGLLGFGIGDTLQLQWLGGFVECVGKALKFCRTCPIHHDDRLEKFESKFMVRDIETNLFQLNLLETSPDGSNMELKIKAFY